MFTHTDAQSHVYVHTNTGAYPMCMYIHTQKHTPYVCTHAQMHTHMCISYKHRCTGRDRHTEMHTLWSMWNFNLKNGKKYFKEIIVYVILSMPRTTGKSWDQLCSQNPSTCHWLWDVLSQSEWVIWQNESFLAQHEHKTLSSKIRDCRIKPQAILYPNPASPSCDLSNPDSAMSYRWD